MKDLSLSNAVRYMFPGLVVYFYLYISDAPLAKQAIDSFANLGITIISIVFLGTLIYLLYRPLFYDYVVICIQDFFRRESDNYRTYLKKRYSIRRHEAALLWIQIRDKYFKDRYSQAMQIHASGIHLLYIAGIIAIFFTIWRFTVSDFTRALLFLIIAVITLLAGFFVDRYYEDIELGFLRSLDKNLLDSSASEMFTNILSTSDKEKDT